MKTALAIDYLAWSRGGMIGGKKERFRKQFLRSLRESIRHGFTIEECFGIIWTETLESCPLNEIQETELYQEMIAWAKNGIKRGTFAHYSQHLYTAERPRFSQSPAPYWVAGRIG